jgi:hypothetical protein
MQEKEIATGIERQVKWVPRTISQGVLKWALFPVAKQATRAFQVAADGSPSASRSRRHACSFGCDCWIYRLFVVGGELSSCR